MVRKWEFSSIIISHLRKLWKAKFFILCDIIFLVRLQGKFEIDHSWAGVKGLGIECCTYQVCLFSARWITLVAQSRHDAWSRNATSFPQPHHWAVQHSADGDYRALPSKRWPPFLPKPSDGLHLWSESSTTSKWAVPLTTWPCDDWRSADAQTWSCHHGNYE